MDLKIVNNIDNNIFSTDITVDAFGTEHLSEDEEKELLANFPTKLAYRNLKFTKNIKIEGTVPKITEDEADSESVVTVTIPPLSNKEILIDGNFNAYYKVDCSKIAVSALDKNILNTKELVAQTYCLIFSQVVCDAVREIMGELRAKAPAFEGETIVSV